LVDVDGSQRGVVSLREALDAAAEAGLDLAEIAPTAQPPVVKILDWGKYRYEQTKQLAKSKKNQKQVEVKQVRLGLKIGEHDLQVKLSRAIKFLEQGHKVKISLLFRGREISRPELGRAILDRVMEQLSEVAVQEQAPQLSGRDLNMILGSKKDSKDAKTQDS
jgi:translation initiation factor IF-3